MKYWKLPRKQKKRLKKAGIYYILQYIETIKLIQDLADITELILKFVIDVLEFRISLTTPSYRTTHLLPERTLTSMQ